MLFNDPVHHPIVECSNCGMVYALTPHDQAWYDRYYAEQSKYAVGFEEWNRDRYAAQAERIGGLIWKRDSVVDVGCATGGLVKALIAKGFKRVAGVDPSQECVDRLNGDCADFYNRIAYRGTVFDVGRLIGSPNAVILSGVLEHLVDCRRALQRVAEVADQVYVEVPDATRYADNERSPYQQFNAEHLNHFSLPHLIMLTQYCGFQVQACGQYTVAPNDSPEIWGLFRKQPSLADEVRRYCDVSAGLMVRVDAQVRAVEGPVITWGIGALARRLELLLIGKVRCAIDANPPNEMYCGAEVITPEYFGDWTAVDVSIPIIVTTILHRESVLRQISELGLRNKVITLGD